MLKKNLLLKIIIYIDIDSRYMSIYPVKFMEFIMTETLVVASKIKKVIKDKSGFNTSAAVFDRLTELVEKECDRAIENARRDNRKTVMDRDFHFS